MSAKIAARIFAVIMFGVVLFQIALIFGAPLGEFTQGGYETGELASQGRIVAAVSAIALSVMALVMLALVKEGPLKNRSPKMIRRFAIAATAYSGIGILMNLASRSESERLLWTPITLAGFVLGLVALRKSR